MRIVSVAVRSGTPLHGPENRASGCRESISIPAREAASSAFERHERAVRSTCGSLQRVFRQPRLGLLRRRSRRGRPRSMLAMSARHFDVDVRDASERADEGARRCTVAGDLADCEDPLCQAARTAVLQAPARLLAPLDPRDPVRASHQLKWSRGRKMGLPPPPAILAAYVSTAPARSTPPGEMRVAVLIGMPIPPSTIRPDPCSWPGTRARSSPACRYRSS